MSFQPACELADLGDAPVGVEVDGVAIALVRVGEDVFAIKDECSHGYVRLSEGDVDEWDCSIECYLHGGQFDLRTGSARTLPATDPVPVYPVSVVDGQVLVDVDNPLNSESNKENNGHA